MSDIIPDHTTQISITRDVQYVVAKCSRSRCGRTDVPTQSEMEVHLAHDYYNGPPVMQPFIHYWPAGWTLLVNNYRYEGCESKAFCPDCRPQ